MRRLAGWVIVSVLLVGCAANGPLRTSPVPPRPESLPHPTMETLLETGKSELRAATDTITPTESASLEFCSLDSRWTALPQADKWVQYKVDGDQHEWPGAVVPTHDNCFMTPKAFIFSAGVHQVTVALVYPPGYVQTCASGATGCVSNGCAVGPECYGGVSEPLTVISAVAPASFPGAPPSIVRGQVIR